MSPWKHRLLAYAILVLVFSIGLFTFQHFLLGKCHQQVAEKPALADIKAIADSNDLAPEIVRGVLEADAPPTNNAALSQIWSLAKDNDISKYEASFFLDPKKGTKPKGLHLIVLSQVISIGFVVGAYGIVHAIVGAFVGTKTAGKKKSKKAQSRRHVRK